MTNFKQKVLLMFDSLYNPRSDVDKELIDSVVKVLDRDENVQEILNRDCTDITKFVLIRELYEDNTESENKE